MKALSKILQIWNILPIPIKISFEDLTAEEAQSVTEAIKPGVKAALPGLGKKHPFGMMIWTAVIVLIAKIKIVLGFKAKENQKIVKLVSQEVVDE